MKVMLETMFFFLQKLCMMKYCHNILLWKKIKERKYKNIKKEKKKKKENIYKKLKFKKTKWKKIMQPLYRASHKPG